MEVKKIIALILAWIQVVSGCQAISSVLKIAALVERKNSGVEWQKRQEKNDGVDEEANVIEEANEMYNAYVEEMDEEVGEIANNINERSDEPNRIDKNAKRMKEGVDEEANEDENANQISHLKTVNLSQGEADATSVFNETLMGAANAFKRAFFRTRRLSDRSFPWISRVLPATVYIKLPNAVKVSAFSFRSRPEYGPEYRDWILKYSPKKFELVGSEDCANWRTIFRVESTTWTTSDQEKMWVVPEEQRASFPCIGFKVLTNGWKRLSEYRPEAAIQDARFWEADESGKRLLNIIVAHHIPGPASGDATEGHTYTPYECTVIEMACDLCNNWCPHVQPGREDGPNPITNERMKDSVRMKRQRKFICDMCIAAWCSVKC